MVILSIVIGGVITILTAIGVEWLRRPKLRLAIEEKPVEYLPSGDNPARRHLRLRLINDSLPRIARWMLRSAALQCRGEIRFHHLDGQRVYDRAMSVRWARLPEPVASQVISIPDNIPHFYIRDFARTFTDSRIDVYPGEEEILDVAVRFDGEPDCYGWNNEAYLNNWRTPSWKLPRDRYLVEVVINSSGQKCVGLFRLINDVAQLADFRLSPPLPNDNVNP